MVLTEPSPPTAPTTEVRRRRILVAKKLKQVNLETDASKPQKLLPISFITTKNKGPKRTKDGKIIAHTLIGDAEEFAELEHIYVSANDSSIAKKHSAQQQGPVNASQTNEMIIQKQKQLEEKKQKELADREDYLKRLHLFQRYIEVRQEHALNNWKRHSVEWHKVEQRIGKKAKKDPSELLMAKISEFRLVMEEHELMEEAMKLLEHRKVDFWKTGLCIGSDLLGLTLPMPKGGPREVERLRFNEKLSDNLLKHGKDYRDLKKKDFKNVLEMLDPFYLHNNGGFMEIVGHGVSQKDQLTEAFVKRLEEKSWESPQKSVLVGSANSHHNELIDANTLQHDFPIEENDSSSNQYSLSFAIRRLTFEVYLNEVSSSVLTIHNTGTAAYHFEWVIAESLNPLKTKANQDGIQRFYFHYKKGVILPGTAFDFIIVFKSSTPGVYSESWELRTSPSIPEAELKIDLQGMAIERDDLKEKRDEITKVLERKKAITFSTDIINNILKSIPSHKPFITAALDGDVVETKQKSLYRSPDEHMFVVMNKDLKLNYIPHVYDKLVALSKEGYAVLANEKKNKHIPKAGWNGSVKALYELFDLVDDNDSKSSLLGSLNELVVQCNFVPSYSISSMLYMIAYDVLAGVADSIVDSSEAVRKKLGLPLVRMATQKFIQTADETLGEDSNDFSPYSLSANNGSGNPTNNSGNPGAGQQAAGNAATAAADDKKKAAQTAAAPKKGAPAPALAAAATSAAADKKDVKKPPAKKPSDSTAPAEDNATASGASIRRQFGYKKKPDSSSGWSKERRIQEAKYQSEFSEEATLLVHKAITRITRLFSES